MSKSSTFLASAALAACTVLTGCGGDDSIVIGIAGPMSGSAAAFGEQITNAAKLKVKEINDAGGIEVEVKQSDGTMKKVKKKVRLRIEDDKGDTTEATNVARSLASDKSVSIVVGHFNSTCSNAAKEEYNRKHVVEFSPGSTNTTVCKGSPWTFRNLYQDDFQGQFLAVYAKNKLGATKVALFYDNDDYGKGLRNSFKAKAEKIGLKIVADEPYIREKTQDFKPLVEKAAAAKPDLILVCGLYNEGALIAKAARTDLKLTVNFLGGDGLLEEDFIKIGEKASEGAFVTTPFLFNTGKDSAAATSFLTAYKKAYNEEPNTWAALTYDAVGMALEAIRTVGTDREAIQKWFAAATTPAKGYQGVTGNTYFDSEGDCYSKPIYVATVKDGKFVPAEQMALSEMKD